MQTLHLDKKTIDGLSLEEFRNYDKISESEFFGKAGTEHYKLLAFLSQQMNDVTIFDIGSFRGVSAMALALNPTNDILSFDIEDKVFPSLKKKENVRFHLANLFDHDVLKSWEDLLLSSPIIFLDIDPHDGKLEYQFYLYLKEKNYRGLLILDDIWYFKGMRDNLWMLIPPENKIDVTDLGHWSGTGIVYFKDCRFKIDYKKPSTDNWTLVTGYFDLTKCPDASVSINKRPAHHYLSTANATMCSEQNLAVFCENEENKAMLEKLRPAHLKSKTRYYLIDFEDFPMTKYRNKIIQNRKDHPYHFDDRNTASYYLLCMSRYAMLKQVMKENPFNSTHFGWINICIERMGFKNIQRLNEGLSLYRDKFSTCYIDYVPPETVKNVPVYYQFGRCSMCSGFFTGNKEYMTKFCNAVENKFLEFLELGYGHADEQLFSAVYFDNPEIFEFYYGDYHQMISNYAEIYDKIETPISIFITRTFQHKRWDLCKPACEKVWHSYKNKLCPINKNTLLKFLQIYSNVCVMTNDFDMVKSIGNELLALS